MQLTKEQIQTIDAILEKKGIKYIDIKLELIDHIASEIEAKLEEEDISFYDALNCVIKKWQHQFAYTSSFWTGKANSLPKIVLDKLIMQTKKATIYNLILTTIWLMVFGFFQIQLNKILAPFSKAIVISSIAVSIIISLLFIIINVKAKPTLFRFQVNQTSTIALISIFILILDKEVAQFQFFCLTLLIYNSIHIFKKLISHRKFIQKIEA